MGERGEGEGEGEGEGGLKLILEPNPTQPPRQALGEICPHMRGCFRGSSRKCDCEQGRDLGFDGKTLIHPKQLEIANRVFAPAGKDVENAEQIIAAWKEAKAEGKGVVVVNGKLVENLHVEEARRTLALAEAIRAMT